MAAFRNNYSEDRMRQMEAEMSRFESELARSVGAGQQTTAGQSNLSLSFIPHQLRARPLLPVATTGILHQPPHPHSIVMPRIPAPPIPPPPPPPCIHGMHPAPPGFMASLPQIKHNPKLLPLPSAVADRNVPISDMSASNRKPDELVDAAVIEAAPTLYMAPKPQAQSSAASTGKGQAPAFNVAASASAAQPSDAKKKKKKEKDGSKDSKGASVQTSGAAQSSAAQQTGKPLTDAASSARAMFSAAVKVGTNNIYTETGAAAAEKEKWMRRPGGKKFLRRAGGQTWEDPSLTDWDPSDFRIFCGDLGNEVSDELLAKAFRKYASFQKARVIRDKRTNKTKGYGFVSFKDPQDFIRALREMDGKYVGNRPIKLRKSEWKERNLDVVRKKNKEKQKLGLRSTF